MKLTRFLTALILTLLTWTSSAAVEVYKLEEKASSAQEIKPSADHLITVRTGNLRSTTEASPLVPANATIEVSYTGPLGFGRIVTVNFQEFDALGVGSTIVFYVQLGNRSEFIMNTFTIPEGLGGNTWRTELWGGKFPNAWNELTTTFRVVITNTTDGKTSFVSAEVPGRAFIPVPFKGPLQRMDLSSAGNEISVSGFQNDMPIERTASWARMPAGQCTISGSEMPPR